MSNALEHTDRPRSLSEAVKEPTPQPPLGPPHDAYATVCLGVFFAAGLFFMGYGRTENGWIGWTGMIVSFAALIASVQYFIRAYGFSPRGSIYESMGGAKVLVFFAFFFTAGLVAPAIYTQYAGESTLALVLGFLAIAVLAVAPMRAALGQARPGSPRTSNPELGGTGRAVRYGPAAHRRGRG